MTDVTKTWTTYGVYDEYNEVTKKISELGDKYDLYKIKLIREKKRRGAYKLKVWKRPVEKNNKKKKK
tara:strand:+ start:240 stop:440 length:201 start_codon:yes stop_codon:yes gene_type:complete